MTHTIILIAMGYFFGLGISTICATLFDDSVPVGAGLGFLGLIALIEVGLYHLVA